RVVDIADQTLIRPVVVVRRRPALQRRHVAQNTDAQLVQRVGDVHDYAALRPSAMMRYGKRRRFLKPVTCLVTGSTTGTLSTALFRMSTMVGGTSASMPGLSNMPLPWKP